MEVPQLVRERLGEESVEATVSLGDEDVVCVTPTRTFVYRGEGLLSDEAVSAYSHDVERIDVSEGRRKTKFHLEYVEGSDSFTVPADRTKAVLELLFGGVLHVAGVTVAGESISDVFSFSELTLVVTSHRLVKHVGAAVWDDDFENLSYDDVTGLAFEEGSVATQVVLSVDGRPHRIKAPSDNARMVERTLKQALFAYHDVDSLAELDEEVGVDDTETSETSEESSEGLSLDDGISPLVGGDEDDPSATGDTQPRTATRGASRSVTGSGDRSGSDTAPTSGDPDLRSGGTDATADPGPSGGSSGETVSNSPSGADATVDPDDIEKMKRQLSTLTTAVKKQNQLLRDQQETIDQLIEELRRGR